ncbi:MAG: 2-dehydropantoate 2-reductase [Thermoplasmata archaeon]|nr:2-dehydropantoate 2-reductase [Thermoplasmata archaeon]
MRICVFGAGSLGSAIGGLLSSKHELTLVGRDPHIAAITNSGLRIMGGRDISVHLDARTALGDISQPDLLIMAVKAYDTESAIAICRSVIGEDTMVLTLQNGMGNLEALRSWKGAKAFGGSTTMGAMLESPGTVRLSGLGRTVIGSDIDPDGARKIADALSQSGIPTTTNENVIEEIWSKAIVSASINPLTAVLRISNGALLDSDVISRLMDEVCSECVAISNAAGIPLPHGSLTERVHRVVMGTSSNRSSMLRDVEMGRRTEISQITGIMCKYASSLAVPAPLNRTLLAMVESLAVVRGERLIS